METFNKSFKDKQFKVIKGKIHFDYSLNCFDEPEEKEIKEQHFNIKEGDIVFDIGASYGSYTLPACAAGAIVFAFEPEKTVFDDLVNNIMLNNWHSKCFPFNIGMWENSSIVDMKSYAPHWPAYTISGDYTMDTIDHIAEISQITKLDYIKMDIEGAEEKALKGGLKTIAKFKPKLIIECHNFLDAEISNRVKKMLEPLGYSFIDILREPCVTIVSK